MKTPKHFTENLKNNIITMEMLELALFSINKRAKNWRDKKNEYYEIRTNNKYWTDKYNNIEKCKEKEKFYYEQKELLLKLLTPSCIHCDTCVYIRKNRIYEYEKDYEKHINKGYWENCFYQYGEEIWFVDVPYEETVKKYYLYYETDNYSFHIPIESPDKYNYEVKNIDKLTTYGKDILELVSTQFCNKLIKLVKTNKYKLNLGGC